MRVFYMLVYCWKSDGINYIMFLISRIYRFCFSNKSAWGKVWTGRAWRWTKTTTSKTGRSNSSLELGRVVGGVSCLETPGIILNGMKSRLWLFLRAIEGPLPVTFHHRVVDQTRSKFLYRHKITERCSLTLCHASIATQLPPAAALSKSMLHSLTNLMSVSE